ncbi:MAG: hypothetical protein WBD31_12800, partial [Rubripirellula sp.]
AAFERKTVPDEGDCVKIPLTASSSSSPANLRSDRPPETKRSQNDRQGRVNQPESIHDGVGNRT